MEGKRSGKSSRKSSHKSSRRPYRVGRSATGLGLFATAPIEKGAFIVEYTGRRITNARAKRQPGQQLWNSLIPSVAISIIVLFLIGGVSP